MRNAYILTTILCALGCIGQSEVDPIDETTQGAQVMAPFEASCTAQSVVQPAANIDVAMVPSGAMVNAYRYFLVLDCPDSMPTSMQTQLYLHPLESSPLAQPLDPQTRYTFLLDPRRPWQTARPLLLEIRDGKEILYRRPTPEEAETK